MNVTALLDAPVRSPTPLDSSVGDEGADPAFANVMSQYRDDGNKSLTSGTQSDAKDANDTPPTETGTTANASTGAATTNEAGGALHDELDSSGEALPPPAVVDGQPLPLLEPVTAQLPVPRDPADPLDATDASAAAAMIGATAPPPAPVVTTAGMPATSAMVAPAADVVDAPRAAAPQITDPATPDADAPVQLPPVDPRATKQDAQAAATAQTTMAPPADDSALRSGSVVHALRAFGLGHQQSAADGSAMPHPDARQRDQRGSSAGQLHGEGAPKIANVHLASALEAVSQKDSALLQKDGAEPIRTDAVSPRSSGFADASRDTAAARLSDLAQQHAPRFAAELADRVLVLRSQRFDSATVSLEPRELGRIDIQVRLQADATHIAFTAQHAVVKDALEGQMPRLRAMLEEAGLSLGNVDVSHSGSRGAGDSGTARSYAGSQVVTATDLDTADSSPRWQRRIEASLIDLHA